MEAPDRWTVSHSLPRADLALAIRRTGPEKLLTIKGRVWISEGAGGAKQVVDLVWVSDDHVLAHQRVRSGELFTMTGATPPSWRVELCLPDADSLVIVTDQM